MSQLFKRIDTVFLKVVHFEEAINWYCSVLGFSLRWKDVTNGYAAINIGETPLTLVRADKDEIQNGHSKVFFNFFTADIEAAYQQLVNHHVSVGEIHEDGGTKWFEFKDLEGNRLEVCHFSEN